MIALFSLRSVHEELAQEGPDVTQGTSTGRILVFLGYSGTPVVFGIISYILARPVLDASDAVANASVVRLEPLLLWATFAFSVASCSTIAAQTGIVRSRLGAFLGSGFGRVLPLSVVPTTAVVFALVLLLLLLAYTDSVLAGAPVASDSALLPGLRRRHGRVSGCRRVLEPNPRSQSARLYTRAFAHGDW